MKHCDLTAILGRVDSLQGGNLHRSTLLYDDVPDMVAEIDAMRDGLAEAIELLRRFGAINPDIRHLRALLPTKETTDAE